MQLIEAEFTRCMQVNRIDAHVVHTSIRGVAMLDSLVQKIGKLAVGKKVPGFCPCELRTLGLSSNKICI
mgnify:CR=1 FL=1